MTQPFKVAIVGAGIGELHATAFARLPTQFAVTIICDQNLERGGKLADQFVQHGLPRPALAPDFTDASLASDAVDIIDVCLPPFLHYDAVKAAFDVGKHVICEKPLARSLREVDQMAEMANAKKRLLMPVFQYRFGNGLAKAKHLMTTGAAGKVYLSTIETHWTRGQNYYAVQWRGRKATELGGVFAGHAIYAHDMLTHLLGPVRSVSAMATVRVNAIETEDCAAALFEMADGSIVSTSATLGSADEISRIRICCENVTMISSLQPYTPNRDPWTFIPKAPKDNAFIDQALAGAPTGPEGYTEQFEQFYDSLTRGTPLPITLADGRRSIELLTALYRSAETGNRIALPLETADPAYAGWLK